MKDVVVRLSLAAVVLSLLSACESTYYATWEKLGYAKRDILAERVEEARDAQDDAKEEFKDALEQFTALTGFKGGELESKYKGLSSQYDSAKSRAATVSKRIVSVEDVAGDLFAEWEKELDQYQSADLRRSSEKQLDQTRARYQQVINAMKKAEGKMAPVLRTLGDQVLFLKHNLNAQAIASLSAEQASLETDVAALIRDMEAAINEANAFIDQMGK